MQVVHIEKKAMPPEDAVAVLQAALVGKERRRLTAADASLATGLPLVDAEAALLALTSRHPCRVGVTEDGRIEVTFERFELAAPGPLLRARAWLAARRDQVLAAFTVLALPVLIVVGLGGTFAMMYGLELAPDLPSGLVTALKIFGGLVALLWLAVLMAATAIAFLTYLTFALLLMPIIVWFRPLYAPEPDFELGRYIGVSIVASLISAALGWQAWRVLRSGWRKVFAGESAQWAVRFWRELGGLFFGAPRPRVDALSDERALVDLIHERGGVVTTADLMGLFGWMPERADSEIVRVMMDYGGDVVVSESGAILWVFPELARQGPSTRERPRFRAAVPAPTRFFACRRSTTLLGLMVLVPVIVGPLIHPHLIAWPTPAEMFVWHGPIENADPGMQGMGAWPGLLLFAGLLMRVPSHIARRYAERQRHRELTAIEVLCDSPRGAWVPPETLDTRVLARLDGELGESRSTARGVEQHLAFPTHAAAFDAAERVRNEGASALAGMTF